MPPVLPRKLLCHNDLRLIFVAFRHAFLNSSLVAKLNLRGHLFKAVWEYDNLYWNAAEKWYDGMSLVRTLSFSYSAAGDLVGVSDPAAGDSLSKELRPIRCRG